MNTTASSSLRPVPTAAPRVYAGFPRLSTRVQANGGGPNHHLFNNNGTWFLHYTLYPDPLTKQRVRVSLKTPSLVEARMKRDAFFAQLPGGEVILNAFARATAA